MKDLTFDDFDKLNLKSFGEKLFNIIDKGISFENELSSGFQVSLNAEFGNGKTIFLKMFQNFIEKEKKDGYHVIFIDAWKSDYAKEPIIPIISELVEILHIKENGRDIKDILVNLVDQFVKNKIGISFKDAESNSKKFIDIYTNQKDAIKQIKKEITNLIKTKKLLIIVDELDRARPDYAIHFLEDMKHFFDIENVSFLVGVNRKQMETTAKSLYGENLNFEGYYGKFFKHEINLPDPYKQAHNLINSRLKCYSSINYVDGEYRKTNIFYCCKMFSLTLREIDSFIRIFINVVENSKLSWVYMDATSFIICWYLKEKNIFENDLNIGDFIKITEKYNKIKMTHKYMYMLQSIGLFFARNNEGDINALNNKFRGSKELYYKIGINYIDNNGFLSVLESIKNCEAIKS